MHASCESRGGYSDPWTTNATTFAATCMHVKLALASLELLFLKTKKNRNKIVNSKFHKSIVRISRIVGIIGAETSDNKSILYSYRS